MLPLSFELACEITFNIGEFIPHTRLSNVGWGTYDFMPDLWDLVGHSYELALRFRKW